MAPLGNFNRRGISGLISDITAPPTFGMPGQSLTAAPDPTWRERIARLMIDKGSSPDFVGKTMGTTGIGESGLGVIDITPAGTALFMQETDDPQMAAMAAIPGAKGAAALEKVAAKAAIKGGKKVARGISGMLGRNNRLVVARKMPDGSIKVGNAGDTHRALMGDEYMTDGDFFAQTGWVTPDGEYLTRNKATDWLIKNDPEIGEITDPALEAADYLTALSYKGRLSSDLSGRRAAITANNLRDLPFDEAARIAESEQHVIPKVAGIGHNKGPALYDSGFVGAPAWVRSRDDLAKMRQQMDEQIESGISGSDWYHRAQAGVAELAGSGPAKQHLLAQELALTSSQATPDTNLGFALSGHNAYEAGAPVGKKQIRTGQQARTYIKGRGEGEIKLGRKTGVYGQHLDPTMENPATGTNDIWHARLFGYTNPGTDKPFNRYLSAQQHAFMDAETILAAQRANTRKMGGRSDWTAGEIQAAPWVAGKARGLTEKYPGRFQTPELAMAEASKSYPDYFNKYTANATYEMTPGRMTGHHPALVDAPFSERMGFSTDPRARWTDDEGRDILYDSLGMHQRQTLEATGVYQPPTGGPLENNPAFVARPMVGFTGKSGNREIDPSSAAMMSGAEAARAVLSGQGAGAWSKAVTGNRPGLTNAIELSADGKLTPEQIAALKETGAANYGTPDVVDTGKSAVMASFGGNVDKNAIRRDLMFDENMTRGIGGESILQDRFRQIIPGTKAQPAHMQGDYLGFEDAWTQGEGSGAVTRQLQEYLTRPDAPQLIEKLDASPALRQKALQLLDQSNERWAMSMDPARRDLQNLRQIFADSGFAGVFEALKTGGVALPVAALILGPAFSEAQGE